MFTTVEYFRGVDGGEDWGKRRALWDANVDDGDWVMEVLIEAHYYLAVC